MSVAVDPSDPDPAEELLVLTRALRALAEHHRDVGASGLPSAPRAAATLPTETGRPSPAGTTPAPIVGAPPPPVRPATPSPAAALAPDERKRRLEVLAANVAACTKCRLHERRKQTVFARGTGSSGLVFVGEGPGADEDDQGLPFVGKAGQLLDRMVAAMGLDRDAVYVCNVVKCRPPDNRKPEPDEMEACVPFLKEQLELLDPKALVLLGATALEGLLGQRGGITRLRGKWKLYAGRLPVMPTFHPAYLLRNPSAKRAVWEDLQAVMQQLGRPVAPKA